MSEKPIKYTGDDWDFTLKLKTKNPLGAADVSGATAIKVQIVDKDQATPNVLVAEVAADPQAAGADWSTGIVKVTFPAASTGSITATTGFLEVQKEEGGLKTTWPRDSFHIKQGTIS